MIQRLAEDLTGLLLTRDPLSENVHHSKPRAAWLALGAVLRNGGAAMSAAAMPDTLRKAVSGSSFYAGMRILPKAEREAMFAVYGFCRVVDDIADDQQGDPALRQAQMQQWRDSIAALYAGRDAGRGRRSWPMRCASSGSNRPISSR